MHSMTRTPYTLVQKMGDVKDSGIFRHIPLEVLSEKT
jgi:hypothetical protein